MIVFTHLAFVVEYLDPSGLLCCKYLHMQAKRQYERSILLLPAMLSIVFFSCQVWFSWREKPFQNLLCIQVFYAMCDLIHCHDQG